MRHNKKVFVLKKISLDNVKLKHQKEALREVQILRKIKHPHIIRYYHSFIENEYLCILMEYAEGRDLHSLMKRHRHEGKLLAEKELWRIAYEIGLGVHYLHSNNIVHRDIKTAKYFGSMTNPCFSIFLTRGRTVKIGDLGVSRIIQGGCLFQGTRVGTPLYLSPEQVKQQAYDFKVDVWAVGCCLYHLACFEPPFTGDNLIALGNNIVNKKPKSLPEQYSERFSTFLGRMLKKKAFDRPPIRDVLLFIPKSVKQSYRERYVSEQKSLERSDTADPK